MRPYLLMRMAMIDVYRSLRYTMAALLASYMSCTSLPQIPLRNHSTHRSQSALVSLLYCPIAASIAELASAVPASGGGKPTQSIAGSLGGHKANGP